MMIFYLTLCLLFHGNFCFFFPQLFWSFASVRLIPFPSWLLPLTGRTITFAHQKELREVITRLLHRCLSWLDSQKTDRCAPWWRYCLSLFYSRRYYRAGKCYSISVRHKSFLIYSLYATYTIYIYIYVCVVVGRRKARDLYSCLRPFVFIYLRRSLSLSLCDLPRWCWWWIGSLALRIIGLVVPSEVAAGRDALLQCHYDLEGSSLYALKWYKGSHGE